MKLVFYELWPMNLYTLPPDETERVLANFTTFLNSLQNNITFYIISDVRHVQFGGYGVDIAYKRFFVASPVEIDYSLAAIRTKYVRVPETDIPRVKVIHASAGFLVDSEKYFLRSYSITNLSGNLPAGFLSSLYGFAYEVKVDVAPIKQLMGRKLAKMHAFEAETLIKRRVGAGATLFPDEQVQYEKAKSAATLIAQNAAKIFATRVVVTLRAKDWNEMKSLHSQLKQNAGLFEIDAPRYIQESLYSGTGPSWALGRSFYMTSEAASAFFPFHGLDLVDPMGVFMGVNRMTGNAVLFDVWGKNNYGVAMMGKMGAGKSMLMKAYIERIVHSLGNEKVYLFTLDAADRVEYAWGPDGTYENSFAGLTGSHVKRFNEPAGFDPFMVFGNTSEAASIVADIAGFGPAEQDLRVDLYDTAQRSNNVVELIENSSGSLKKRLKVMLQPYETLFSGNYEPYEKEVFVLSDIQNTTVRKVGKYLVMAYVWKLVTGHPANPDIIVPSAKDKKILLLDEGWSLLEKNTSTNTPLFSLAAQYMNDIVRTSRKFNLLFLFATQMVEDVMNDPEGKIILSSCATKIVQKQDQASAETLKNAFALSPEEERFVKDAVPGESILITEDGRIPFYAELSPLELSAFSTKPKDQM